MSSISIKKAILKNITAKALTAKDTGGHRTLADLASDIVNNSSGNDKQLAGLTDLSPSTIKRIRENIQPYNPNTRTVERILIAHGFTLAMH